MSADNGVYILATKRGKTNRQKREYRVAHVQAIENITDAPDHPSLPGRAPVLNSEEVENYFGHSRVFTDLHLAEGYATKMLDDLSGKGVQVEYGIQLLNFGKVRFPRSSQTKGLAPAWRGKITAPGCGFKI